MLQNFNFAEDETQMLSTINGYTLLSSTTQSPRFTFKITSVLQQDDSINEWLGVCI